MKEILEGSTCFVRIDFKDENGADVMPTSGRYRVHDAESGTQIVDWTMFMPSGAYITLAVDSNSNRLIDQAHVRETRVVTVEFTYGAFGYIGTGEARYTVLGLEFY